MDKEDSDQSPWLRRPISVFAAGTSEDTFSHAAAHNMEKCDKMVNKYHHENIPI